MTVGRRQFVLSAGAAGVGLLAGCGRLPFQQDQPLIYRVGYLTLPAPPAIEEAFRAGLRDLGYIEGQNLRLGVRQADSEDQLGPLAAELAALPVQVLVARTGTEATAARSVTSTIPIVFGGSSDPVAAGLVASLARPGGNVTGLSTLNSPLVSKQLELLKWVIPSLSRIGLLENRANPLDLAGDVSGAAAVLGLQLQILGVQSPTHLDGVLTDALDARVAALVALPAMLPYRDRIASFALEQRLPLIAGSRGWTASGALLSYGSNSVHLVHRAAYYVDRILRGTKPADLPVEQPMTFDFVVNMKTAQALGITFPNEIMLQVTEVLE